MHIAKNKKLISCKYYLNLSSNLHKNNLYQWFSPTLLGGTTDVAVYKVNEISAPRSGPWGSTQIDEAFEKLLYELLGEDFVDSLKSSHSQHWLNLMLKFEKAKKSFDCYDKNKINIDISCSAISDKLHGNTKDNIFDRYKNVGISMKDGYLSLTAEKSKTLIEPVVSNIVDYVLRQLEDGILHAVSHLILVGGFGTSSLLKDELQKRITASNISILVPHEPELAVVKGAVMLGLNDKDN